MADRNQPSSNPEVARVDFLVDERGHPIEPPHPDEGVKAARDREPNVGGTGPTNWWRYGLVALGVIALILLIMQLFSGGANTNTAPASPTTPPAAAPAQGQ
jgi:hypothetical protein